MTTDTPRKPPATEAAIENAREALAQASFKHGRAMSTAILSAARAKADQEALERTAKAKQEAEEELQDLVRRFMEPAGQEEALQAIREKLGSQGVEASISKAVLATKIENAQPGDQPVGDGAALQEVYTERQPRPAPTIAHKVEPAPLPVYTYTGRHSPLFPKDGETWLDENWKPPLPKKRVGGQWVSMEKDVKVGIDLAKAPDQQIDARVEDGKVVDVLGIASPLGPNGPKLEVIAGRPELAQGGPEQREPMEWPRSVNPPPLAQTREGDRWHDPVIDRLRTFTDGAWDQGKRPEADSYWPGGDAKEG